MTGDSHVTIHKGAVAVLVMLALLGIGIAGAYLLRRGRIDSPGATMKIAPDADARSSRSPAAPAGVPIPVRDSPLPDVVVSLASDAIERAGIVVAPVAGAEAAGGIRLPGVVQPNAYRQVVVTPLVAGRVTRVSTDLGSAVRGGQTLAQIYSPELAEAQTKYVSAKALLDAHDRELQRTQKLVEIGAASRQELERIHAEHAGQTAAIKSARSQLELLGMPGARIDALPSGSNINATTDVLAPFDGVLTERTANVGLNVDRATQLFKVVDLSTVWIVADLYERDFSRVRVGNETTITTAAYPGLSLHGRVSYIDPQLHPETRTAKVRVEVANPGGQLRLGMFADVVVASTSGVRGTAAVPRGAVQNVGERTVVYLADPKAPGRFVEREVRLGDATGNRLAVVSGVQPGDVIVTEGSFFVRAERERLGLRQDATTSPTQRGTQNRAGDVQIAKIVVNERGFEPAKVSLRAGTPAQITFMRMTEKTCATDVAFPSLNITRTLPLNEPVVIEFTPAKSGNIAFACGMNMLHGVVTVQ